MQDEKIEETPEEKQARDESTSGGRGYVEPKDTAEII